MTPVKRGCDLAHRVRSAPRGKLAEPGDVLVRTVGHQHVNPQGILWIGDSLQAPIGVAGPIHFAMAAVDENNAVGLTTPGPEVLQQVEEASITAASQPPRAIS